MFKTQNLTVLFSLFSPKHFYDICPLHIKAFNYFQQIAQTMAREADRILRKKYPDAEINIEPVQEPPGKAHGNGTGIM